MSREFLLFAQIGLRELPEYGPLRVPQYPCQINPSDKRYPLDEVPLQPKFTRGYKKICPPIPHEHLTNSMHIISYISLL